TRPLEAMVRRRLLVCLRQMQLAPQPIKLRFMEALVVLLDHGERLVERLARIIESSRHRERLAENSEIIGKAQAGAAGAISLQSIWNLRQTFLELAAKQKAGAVVYCPGGVPELNPLIHGDTHLLLSRHLRMDAETAMLMQPTGVVQRVCQAEWMLN